MGGEVKENLVDGEPTSKWLTFAPTGWAEFDLDEPAKVVTYALTSANDHAERDPKDWTLQGSTDGKDWKVLDTRKGESFPQRHQTKKYDFENSEAYSHYRLDITANNGASDALQLSDVQLSVGGSETPAPEDMLSLVDRGPSGSPTAKSGAGFTGKRALRYSRHPQGGRPRLLVQQGLRCERLGPPGHRTFLSRLPVHGRGRPRLRRHERVPGPGLHRRHLSE